MFVKNLPYDVNEDGVNEALAGCGRIASVRLAMWNHTRKLKVNTKSGEFVLLGFVGLLLFSAAVWRGTWLACLPAFLPSALFGALFAACLFGLVCLFVFVAFSVAMCSRGAPRRV